jgi:hypothetical protein
MVHLRTVGAALIVLGAACGGEKGPTGPEAGDLTVSYAAAPGANDGALLLLVTGGPVTSISALSGHRVESAPAGANATRIVVTGQLVPGDILRLRVPDVAVRYVVLVEAAADRATFALRDPGSYSAASRR